MIIDVGANLGQLSLDIAKKNPNIQCIAIEPIPYLAREIEKTAKVLKLENIMVITKAIQQKESLEKFYISTEADQGGSSLLEFNPELMSENEYWQKRVDLRHQETIEVQTDSLRGILKIYPKRMEIEFIKIDAQGLDVEVLISLGSRLRDVQLGMIEVAAVNNTKLYKSEKSNLQSCLVLLEKKNFKVFAIKPNDPASNEFNVFFARNDVDERVLIHKLGLDTNDIFSGKWYWENPSRSLQP